MIRNSRTSKAASSADSYSLVCLREPSRDAEQTGILSPYDEAMSRKSGKEYPGMELPEKFFNCAPVGCMLIDEEARILQINPTGASLLGKGDIRLLQGKSFLNFVSKASQHNFLTHLKTCSAGKDKQQLEVKLRIPKLTSGLPIRLDTAFYGNSNGNAPLLISVLTDLREHKQKEETLQQELEKSVADRTAELAAMNKALRKKIAEHKETEKNIYSDHEQLRALTSALITTEERERRRIATELHDHIGQTLAITRIKLEMLHALASYSGFAEALEEIQGFVKQAIKETRSLMTKLSPPVFYELGLNAALEWLMQYFGEQHNLRINYRGKRDPFSINEDLQILLLQATRELLMNVVKHAGVEEAEVTLRTSRKQIKIEVIDHGAGFEVSKIGTPLDWRGGFGIFSIHERLKNLGGQLQIHSKRGEGTHFTLVAPHGTKEGL
ncbi:MAG: Oxygen sensor histidine kinase NreB [Syntrophus sp. PtaU1.Bin208]|nr:MAG: Oxygen sensor histidine kinase NreB [Syntrophus sp. PtaU1.Bin208]